MTLNSQRSPCLCHLSAEIAVSEHSLGCVNLHLHLGGVQRQLLMEPYYINQHIDLRHNYIKLLFVKKKNPELCQFYIANAKQQVPPLASLTSFHILARVSDSM